MKKKILCAALAAVMVLAAATSCGKKSGPDMSQVADSSEMTTVEDVVDEGMTPVTADMLKDGTYEVTMRSSSSMFKVDKAELTVSSGAMEAKLFMHSDSYGYMFAGTAQEASKSDDYIPFEKSGEGGTFTIPVEALDAGISAAAFSNNKEKWYDRTLLFEAASLPDDAFLEKRFTTAEDLGIEDGIYICDVTLSGGSGKASVKSPCSVEVKDGKCTATIEWSSPNYDFMMVDDKRYDPINTDGNSVFEIPVIGFDYEMPIQADTTAMSEPHLIDYTLTFKWSGEQ